MTPDDLDRLSALRRAHEDNPHKDSLAVAYMDALVFHAPALIAAARETEQLRAENERLKFECSRMDEYVAANATYKHQGRERDALAARLEVAVGLLHRFDYEDQPCRLDHHGYCQVHPGLTPPEEGGCAIAAFRAFLAEHEAAKG